MWCWSFVDGTGIEFGSELLLLSVGIGGGGIVGSGRDGILREKKSGLYS